MKGWRRAQLRELTTKIGSGATPRGGEESYKAKGIPLIRSLNVLDAGFSYRNLAFLDDAQASALANVEVRPGDVLLNITGASVARCCLVAEDVCPARVNQHVSIIRPIAGKVLPKFLHYLLVSPTYKKLLLQTGEDNGSTRQAITKAQIEAFAIDFPESIPEQQRIVAILDEAFEAIAAAKANTEKNLQNARALFERHLNSVFEDGADGWTERRLDEIGTTQTGTTPKTSDQANYGTAIPFIKPSDFRQDGSLDFDNDGLSEQGQLATRVVRGGSVLMVCIGATIGKCGYTDRNVTTNQQINALTPKSEHDYKFCYYQMRSANFQKRVLDNSGQATLPIINKSKWSALTLRIPKDIHTQREISDQCAHLNEETINLESVYKRKYAELERLQQSLLHQAFTGNL